MHTIGELKKQPTLAIGYGFQIVVALDKGRGCFHVIPFAAAVLVSWIHVGCCKPEGPLFSSYAAVDLGNGKSERNALFVLLEDVWA